MNNTEQLRHQYLEAMGIPSWLSCAELPAAAPSPPWVKDFQYLQGEQLGEGQPAAVEQTQTPASSQAQKAEQANHSLAALREMAEPKTSSPASSHKANSSSRAKLQDAVPDEPEATTTTISRSETLAPPNFKIAFYRVGNALVVDSLPPQGGHFSQPYQSLATAIVASLGLGGEAAEPFMLPWPIFASKTLDQSRPQAVIAVQHKLKKVLNQGEFKALLLFGESAAQMVLDRREPLTDLSGILLTVIGGVKTIASASLTEAMQLSGVKKQIWQDLQPLLAHLETS